MVRSLILIEMCFSKVPCVKLDFITDVETGKLIINSMDYNGILVSPCHVTLTYYLNGAGSCS